MLRKHMPTVASVFTRNGMIGKLNGESSSRWGAGLSAWTQDSSRQVTAGSLMFGTFWRDFQMSICFQTDLEILCFHRSIYRLWVLGEPELPNRCFTTPKSVNARWLHEIEHPRDFSGCFSILKSGVCGKFGDQTMNVLVLQMQWNDVSIYLPT